MSTPNHWIVIDRDTLNAVTNETDRFVAGQANGPGVPTQIPGLYVSCLRGEWALTSDNGAEWTQARIDATKSAATHKVIHHGPGFENITLHATKSDAEIARDRLINNGIPEAESVVITEVDSVNYITRYHVYVNNSIDNSFTPHPYDVWVRIGAPLGLYSAED